MKPFTIEPNNFLFQNIESFYHTNYIGFDRRNEIDNYPMYLLTLKNDLNRNWWPSKLRIAQRQLLNVLLIDLPEILQEIELDSITVCVVPRAKNDNTYQQDQLLFRDTVRNALNELGDSFVDGIHFISRDENTKTTHLRREIEGYDNDGSEPYPGISIDTCTFANDIDEQDILLIDDIYTSNVNIDEDMIQALLDSGANSVTFYAVGKTIH